MLGVARLVDLLGRQERLLALALVGADEAAELRRDALLPMKNDDRNQTMWSLSSSERLAQSSRSLVKSIVWVCHGWRSHSS